MFHPKDEDEVFEASRADGRPLVDVVSTVSLAAQDLNAAEQVGYSRLRRSGTADKQFRKSRELSLNGDALVASQEVRELQKLHRKKLLGSTDDTSEAPRTKSSDRGTAESSRPKVQFLEPLRALKSASPKRSPSRRNAQNPVSSPPQGDASTRKSKIEHRIRKLPSSYWQSEADRLRRLGGHDFAAERQHFHSQMTSGNSENSSADYIPKEAFTADEAHSSNAAFVPALISMARKDLYAVERWVKRVNALLAGDRAQMGTLEYLKKARLVYAQCMEDYFRLDVEHFPQRHRVGMLLFDSYSHLVEEVEELLQQKDRECERAIQEARTEIAAQQHHEDQAQQDRNERLELLEQEIDAIRANERALKDKLEVYQKFVFVKSGRVNLHGDEDWDLLTSEAKDQLLPSQLYEMMKNKKINLDDNASQSGDSSSSDDDETLEARLEDEQKALTEKARNIHVSIVDQLVELDSRALVRSELSAEHKARMDEEDDFMRRLTKSLEKEVENSETSFNAFVSSILSSYRSKAAGAVTREIQTEESIPFDISTSDYSDALNVSLSRQSRMGAFPTRSGANTPVAHASSRGASSSVQTPRSGHSPRQQGKTPRVESPPVTPRLVASASSDRARSANTIPAASHSAATLTEANTPSSDARGSERKGTETKSEAQHNTNVSNETSRRNSNVMQPPPDAVVAEVKEIEAKGRVELDAKQIQEDARHIDRTIAITASKAHYVGRQLAQQQIDGTSTTHERAGGDEPVPSSVPAPVSEVESQSIDQVTPRTKARLMSSAGIAASIPIDDNSATWEEPLTINRPEGSENDSLRESRMGNKTQSMGSSVKSDAKERHQRKETRETKEIRETRSGQGGRRRKAPPKTNFNMIKVGPGDEVRTASNSDLPISVPFALRQLLSCIEVDVSQEMHTQSMTLPSIERLIDEIFRAKALANAADDSAARPRQLFMQFVLDFFLHQHSSPSVGKKAMVDVVELLHQWAGRPGLPHAIRWFCLFIGLSKSFSSAHLEVSMMSNDPWQHDDGVGPRVDADLCDVKGKGAAEVYLDAYLAVLMQPSYTSRPRPSSAPGGKMGPNHPTVLLQDVPDILARVNKRFCFPFKGAEKDLLHESARALIERKHPASLTPRAKRPLQHRPSNMEEIDLAKRLEDTSELNEPQSETTSADALLSAEAVASVLDQPIRLDVLLANIMKHWSLQRARLETLLTEFFSVSNVAHKGYYMFEAFQTLVGIIMPGVQEVLVQRLYRECLVAAGSECISSTAFVSVLQEAIQGGLGVQVMLSGTQEMMSVLRYGWARCEEQFRAYNSLLQRKLKDAPSDADKQAVRQQISYFQQLESRFIEQLKDSNAADVKQMLAAFMEAVRVSKQRK